MTKFDDAAEKIGGSSGNLFAKRPGLKDKLPLAWSAHMDTVSPGLGIRPILEDGIIRSEGTTILASDDKAGVAIILEAIESAIEDKAPLGTLEIIFSVAEEGGLRGAKAFDSSQLESEQIFILDSGGPVGNAVISAPSQKKLRVKVTGRAAHAGSAPEKGLCAIVALSAAISRMKLMRLDEETTANVGQVFSDNATNVISPEACAEFEARSRSLEKLDRQIEHMTEVLQTTCREYGCQVAIETETSYPLFQGNPEGRAAAMFLQACQKVGVDGQLVPTGGGSDANIYSSRGFDVLNLAFGGIGGHSKAEHIAVSSMEKTVAIVREILAQA